jgi:geranylgeranyl transferase type-1 subunit beta
LFGILTISRKYFILKLINKFFFFILKTYEGSFGQNPEAEAHGGSTFCAVASLFLMDRLDVLTEKERGRLAEWCINRQSKGFNGRVNKPNDSCYSWWVGSTLKVKNYLF